MRSRCCVRGCLSSDRVTVATVAALGIRFSPDLGRQSYYTMHRKLLSKHRIKYMDNGNTIPFRHKQRHRREQL